MGKKLTALLLAFVFSIGIVMIKEVAPGLLGQMDTYQFFFWLCIIIAVPLNIYYFISILCVRERNYGGIFLPLLGGLLYNGGLALYMLGVKELGGGPAFQLAFITPLIMVILIPIFTIEKLNFPKIFIFLGTGLGATFIFSSEWAIVDMSVKGILMIVGAAIAWALFIAVSAKNITKLTTSVYIFVMMGALLATGLVFGKSEFMLPSWETFGLLTLLAAIVLIILFIWAGIPKIVDLSFWATLVFLIPLIALTNRVVGGHSATLFEAIGSVIVCGGIAAGFLLKTPDSQSVN